MVMDANTLQKLLPEIDPRCLARAINNVAVRPALEDLDLVLLQLQGNDLAATDKRDWERTRDELVAEVRRLSLRLAGEAR